MVREVYPHPDLLLYCPFDRGRSSGFGASRGSVSIYSTLWRISASCPSDSSFAQGPQKIFRVRYAFQNPAECPHHAWCRPRMAGSWSHHEAAYGCFSFERATCPYFHSPSLPRKRILPLSDTAAVDQQRQIGSRCRVVLARSRVGGRHSTARTRSRRMRCSAGRRYTSLDSATRFSGRELHSVKTVVGARGSFALA